MSKFEKMKLPVDNKHKMKELEQKIEIMQEYISITERGDSKDLSDSLTKNDTHKTKESDQEKLILKELNKKLEKKTELEINHFLEMISHELKTPLTPIKAYAEMLEEGKFGEISEAQRRKLKAIDENSRELIQFISNTIEYQKLSLGKTSLQKEQNDIKKLIRDAHQFFASELDAHGMRINSNFSKPLMITCDAIRISQLFKNLLQVALYSISKKNGKIIFNVWDKEKEVEIFVWYNATDLSKEDLKQIFSEFYKVDTSNIRSNGGIGLALAVCMQIVNAHRGKMWHTLYADGTKISFSLPKE